MKLWFRLTLVCGALLGLLLGLTPPAHWNYQSHVVRSGPCFDQGKDTAFDSSTASVIESMEYDPARAASLESLVLDRALTASNTDPPGQETHGPAEPMGPWRVAGQAGNSNQRHRATFSTNLLAFYRRIKKSVPQQALTNAALFHGCTCIGFVPAVRLPVKDPSTPLHLRGAKFRLPSR